MPDLSCPRCQSPDVRRFSIIYKQGVTNSSSLTELGSKGV